MGQDGTFYSFQVPELLHCSTSASSAASCFVPVPLTISTSVHNFASLLIELHPVFQTFSLTCQGFFWFWSSSLMSLQLIWTWCHLHIWWGCSLLHHPAAGPLLNPTKPFLVFWERHLLSEYGFPTSFSPLPQGNLSRGCFFGLHLVTWSETELKALPKSGYKMSPALSLFTSPVAGWN